MIIKSHARTNGKQLAAYLADYLQDAKNENVTILEIRGSQFDDLHRSLASWEAESHRGKTKKALCHAQMRTPHGEALTREQQLEAVNILERHLGMQGQPRAVVIHQKDAHEHIHVTWSRIDRKTGKAIRDSFTYRKHCEAAREIEERFGLYKVPTPRFKNQDKTKSRKERREESKSAPNTHDYQKAKASGLDPRERKRIVTECWKGSDTGKSLRAALLDSGYILAMGDRRTFVIVDKAGDIHSLARQIQGGRVAAVKERMRDVDIASIPKATHIRSELRAAARELRNEAPRKPRQRRQPSQPPPSNDLQMAATDEQKKAKRDPLDPIAILAELTRQHSTFTKADMDREIRKRLEASKRPFGNERVDDLLRDIRALPDFVPLGKDRVDRPRFTSRDLLTTELTMRNISDDLRVSRLHPVRDDIRTNAPTATQLSAEQKAAYEHVTGDTAINLVVGFAGTGKSFMLRAAREAWEAQGYRVRGAALSSMAADSLRKGSGIESRTLASTLYRLGSSDKYLSQAAGLTTIIDNMRGDAEMLKTRAKLQAQRDRLAAMASSSKLTSRDIVVLDEAAMVGSRQLTQLLTEVKKAGAKIVMVGDAEQLQAIDAGGAFRALRDRHGAVEITEIRRQKEEWQKQASRDFARSFTDDALGAYKQRGFIHQKDTHAEARSQMVTDWTASRKANPEQTHLMMAFTRSDVHELNQEARRSYRDEGKITGADTEVTTAQGKRKMAQGDRIYFLKNDLRLKVMNGSLGTLESVVPTFNADGFTLRVRLDGGEMVKFNTSDYANFTHGYAATVHKAQGATVDKALILASQYMDRHSAYVGMSRHREAANLYYGNDEFDGNGYSSLVRTLSRDNRKDTTLDYLERAEQAGKPETFWNRIKRIVPGIGVPHEMKRPSGRFDDIIARRRAQKAADDPLKTLRDILSVYDRPEREYENSGPSL